jgi:twinkle protein
MAVHQITGLPSISLPFGARHMPDYMVKWLDEYKNLKKIYLWLDEDIAGRANASKMARKLGYERCLIVRTAFFHPDGSYPKDANDALRYNP